MSIITGIKVGSTNITATYSKESDQQPLEVVAASLSTIYKPDDTIYTGYEQTPTPIVKAVVGDNIVTLENGTDYVLTYQNNLNVGTATITATGKGNFEGSVSNTWNIQPANMQVTARNQSYEYDGTFKGDGISVSLIGENECNIVYSLTNNENIPRIKNVDDSTIITYRVTAPNHNPIEGYYSLDITPMTVNLQWGDSEWVYDGESHSTTCIATNTVLDDVCMINLSGNSITNIGSTMVTATGVSNTNYILPSSGLTYIITIKPGLFVKISGVWTPVKRVYKKISGHWVQQNIASTFQTPAQGGLYLKK